MTDTDVTKRPNGTTTTDRIRDLEEDVYGDERRKHPGVLNRLKKVEEGVEDLMKSKLWIKAFAVGLGINIVGGIALLVTMWNIAQRLAAVIPAP